MPRTPEDLRSQRAPLCWNQYSATFGTQCGRFSTRSFLMHCSVCGVPVSNSSPPHANQRSGAFEVAMNYQRAGIKAYII